jgi:hypothetical protein
MKYINFTKNLLNEYLNNFISFDEILNLKNYNKIRFNKKMLKINQWAKKIKKNLLRDPIIVINFRSCIKNSEDLNLFRSLNLYLAVCMGNLVPQDSKGKKVITVYDRDSTKSISSGARYHQTHDGGSIHTDNVNNKEYWNYLFLSCLSQSPVGGESIVVDGQLIFDKLKKYYPKDLLILKKNFWWEKRGISNSHYQSPIIKIDKKKKTMFRYLRPYLESAHKVKKKDLTYKQVKALDNLDKILNSRKNQIKFKLKKYQTLITLDYRVLHGRTIFKDNPKALSIESYNSHNDQQILKRTMDRVWVR